MALLLAVIHRPWTPPVVGAARPGSTLASVSHPMEPVVFDQRSSRERGQAHGELWRREIHQLAKIRLELCRRRGGFEDEEQVLAVAGRHLPVLRAEAPELHDELLGIAQGADASPESIVVLNHYTDLRDVPPNLAGSTGGVVESDAGDPGGCTAIYVHGAEGPMLGQTWDMHADAEPFVRTMRIAPPGEEREALCFTLTGCLALAGLGSGGVAVAVNNLTCTDAKVGLVWPALVRQLLDAADADAAFERLGAAPLSSGHHYMLADGRAFHGVECSGQLKVRTQTGARAAHLHTNHCFDPVLRQRERVSPRSSTFDRLNIASTLYAQLRPSTLDDLWLLLGSHEGYPRSICCHSSEDERDPSSSATCGRLLMQPLQGTMRVGRGCSRNDPGLDLRLHRFHPGADAS